MPKVGPDLEKLVLEGVQLQGAGRVDEARKAFDQALKLDSKHAVALYSLAAIHLNLGNASKGLDFAKRCVRSAPAAGLSWFIQGMALKVTGRLSEAEESFARALAIDPNHVEALMETGVLLMARNEPARALSQFERVLALQPGHALAAKHRDTLKSGLPAASEPPMDRVLRGLQLQGEGRVQEAQAVFREIVATHPRHFISLYSLAAMSLNEGRAQDGLEYAQRCLDAEPGHAFAWYICGCAYKALRQFPESLTHLDRALQIQPNYKEAYFERGILFGELKDYYQSLAMFEKVIELDPVHRLGLLNAATSLTIVKRNADGAAMFERLLAVDPEHDYALSQLNHARLHGCDWRDFHANRATIIERVRQGKRAAKSLSFLAISDSPEDQWICAKTFTAQAYPSQKTHFWNGEKYRHARIRIGYVSPDLREHPVGHLMAGVFECHDKSRYELHAFSLGVDDRGVLRSRFMAACDQFHDVRGRSSREIAQLIRESEIDLVVDLAGPTMDAQPDIFAFRPAPIQVMYLGYPGTSGADYFDYLLADETVVPDESRKFYSEEVIALPGCYLPTDATVKVAERTPTRSEMLLPEQGFVFCSFNHDYKINPDVFDVWMRILKRVEGSVLWLMKLNEAAENNLRKEAEARGVSASRLIFATRVPAVEDHLARYRLAGLFLDTTPYNAHTTATDAMRAGLPVLTVEGKSFQSRVATSILRTVGMPQLAVPSLAEYEDLAVALAHDPIRLAALKQELQEKLKTSSLLDTPLITRRIEAAFEQMLARGGKKVADPAPVDLPSAPSIPGRVERATDPVPVAVAPPQPRIEIGRGPRKILVAGCARDCGKHLPRIFENLRALAPAVGELALLFAENDSRDDTVAVLQAQASQWPAFQVVPLGAVETRLPQRTVRIAHARNVLLEWARQWRGVEQYQYVMLMDLDDVAVRPLDTRALLQTLDFLDASDRAVAGFANQLGLYYDMWALRHPHHCPVDIWEAALDHQNAHGCSNEAAFEAVVRPRMFRIDPAMAPLPVESAFGGLGLYKMGAYLAAPNPYLGSRVKVVSKGAARSVANIQTCEHVHFHAGLRAKGGELYVFPGLVNGDMTGYGFNPGTMASLIF